MFRLSFSFGVFIGDNTCGLWNDDAVQGSQPCATVPTISATLERRQREQEREREILADRESLFILEAATAASSERAKKLDRESLEVLMSITKKLEIQRNSFVTPPKTSYGPARSRSKSLKGTPSFSSPSFSTPRSSESNSGTRNSIHVSERFLTTNTTASKAAIAVAKKTSWEKLSAKLAAAGWSQSSIDAVAGTRSGYPKGQADSVHEIFNRLHQKDAEEQWERFDLQLEESIVTPVLSPGLGHGGSPVRKDRSKEKQRGNHKKHDRNRENLPRLSAKKTISDQEKSEEGSDNEEE